MEVKELMFYSTAIAITVASIYLMNAEVTGYSVALGFKGTGMAVFKPLSWELNSEGIFKISLLNVFDELVTIKSINIILNDESSSESFSELLLQQESAEFIIQTDELDKLEAYELRIRVSFEDKRGNILVDQGELVGIVK